MPLGTASAVVAAQAASRPHFTSLGQASNYIASKDKRESDKLAADAAAAMSLELALGERRREVAEAGRVLRERERSGNASRSQRFSGGPIYSGLLGLLGAAGQRRSLGGPI